MAQRKALTTAAVERIKPPKTGQIEHWDAILPGFALRVTSKKRKSYVLMKRIDGKLVRMTLGQHPALSLASARRKAGEAIEAIERGEDPRIVWKHQKERATERRHNTFEAVAEQFIAKYAKRRNKSWPQAEGVLKRHVIPVWGDRPIDGITRHDVLELLDDLMDRDLPVMANRVLAHIRKLFNWCIERGIIEHSPVAQVKPPAGKEVVRDRELSDEEVKAVWTELDEYPYPFGPMFKLLLVVGQRRTEIGMMKWPDVDLDEQNWTLPKEFAKGGRTHSVPLSPLAVEILEALPRFTGPYVFSTNKGIKPVSGYSRAKQRVEATVNARREERGLPALPNWRLHDLRRTAATGMAKLGIPIEHIGRVLSHAPRGVTATVYDKHTYLPEKRHALEAWARKLESIVRPTRDNVVDLRGSA